MRPLLKLWRAALSARNRKRLVLCGILLAAGLGYIALASGYRESTAASEWHFGTAHRDDERQLRVYVEILAVDAVNDSLRLRISLEPSPALRGRPGTAGQDFSVRLDDGAHAQDMPFPAGEPLTAASFDADLNDGTIDAYPLDRFRCELRIAADLANGAVLPLRATVWDGLAGWRLDVTRLQGDAGGVRLRVTLRRSAGLRMLVLAIYGEMALIGLAALTIGGVVFVGLRPPESTLTGALTGMVFALPVLRYALPGSPPLGVRADLLVFFGAEIAVVLGLLLFIATWAQARPRS